MSELFFDLTYLAIILLFGCTVGTFLEKRHYASIRKREKIYSNLPVSSSKKLSTIDIDENDVKSYELVTGCAVIAPDTFKTFIAGFVNILGGNVKTYETLVDRARKEAMLRMKKQASHADVIINTRIEETSELSSEDVAGVAVIAYGTAITLK